MPAAAAHSLLFKKENAHDDPIYCCAWTSTCITDDPKGPSRDFILTGGLDGIVKVWKYEYNRLEILHSLSSHSMAVVSVAASPDGHTIASASLDSTLIIWDLLSGQKVHEIETESTGVWKLIFSPDGTQVVTGTHTGKVVIYGLRYGTVDRVLDTRGQFVLCVAWSPNNQYLAAGAVDGVVSIFHVDQGKLVHTIDAHRQAVRGVAFSPSSSLLITASDDGKANLYDVASASLKGSLLHNSWAVSATFSPDGGRVATSACDGSVTVATVANLATLATFKEHTDTAWGLQFNKTGNKLMSISKDKSINIYECPIPIKKGKN